MNPKDAFKKSKDSIKQEAKDKKENLSAQFSFSDDEKKKICELVRDMKDEARSARSGFMALREECVRQYEGIKQETSDPWPGHSNISTMVTTVSCDLLQSKIFPMVWNVKSISWESKEDHDPDTAKLNTEVMGWVISVDMAMQNKIDDLCHLLVVDGTVVIKLIWKPYWKWVTRKTPKISAEAIINKKLEYEVSYDYIRDERCELDIRPLERVYIPFHTETSAPRWEDEAEYIIDERWYTLDELREMQLDGLIEAGVEIDKIVSTPTREVTGTSLVRANAEGSTNPPDSTRKGTQKVCVLEAYIKYDANGDKRREQCVFMVAVEPNLVYLSGKPLHLVSRIGRRPFIIRPFIRRPGRAYGKSVPELVRHLHSLLDARFNMLIDAGNKVIGGGGFYRPSSNVNPRRIKAGPATWIPVDDPQRDIYVPQYSLAGLTWGQGEIKFIMDMIERLTYLTPAMLGQETANRPTARGTMAVIQQGEAKFGLMGARVQAIFCDLLTDVRQKYEENMPPAKWERIMGQERLKEYPSPEYMAGMYDCKMQLDVTSLNVEAEMSLATMMMQTMSMDPMVQQNPAFMWEVRADYLRAHRREPVEKYIGPRPPTVADPKDVEEIFTALERETKYPTKGLDPATVMPLLMEHKKTDRYEKFTPEAKFCFNDFVRRLKFEYVDKMQQTIQQQMQGQSPMGTQTPMAQLQNRLQNAGSPGPGPGAMPPQAPGGQPEAQPQPQPQGAM